DFEFVFDCFAHDRPVPVNTESGNHARDAATINWYCDRSAEAGSAIRSVRTIFEEGDPIFETSKIRSQSHVQIAVLDLTATSSPRVSMGSGLLRTGRRQNRQRRGSPTQTLDPPVVHPAAQGWGDSVINSGEFPVIGGNDISVEQRANEGVFEPCRVVVEAPLL